MLHKGSEHYDTRYSLTVAGLAALETWPREDVAQARQRSRPAVRYTVTASGRAALDAAGCDHRASRCARCTISTDRG